MLAHSHVTREAITGEAERLSLSSSGLYWIQYDFLLFRWLYSYDAYIN